MAHFIFLVNFKNSSILFLTILRLFTVLSFFLLLTFLPRYYLNFMVSGFHFVQHDEKSKKRIYKKISFRPLPTFFSAYVLQLLQPESRFTPSLARIFFGPAHLS